ncbi:hypothetical protein C8R47DRAFT_1080576 [Mycena vitilis]|nr:hypothetical protein C8R47DRAFT_1080576 [Mycena vitilis]
MLPLSSANGVTSVMLPSFPQISLGISGPNFFPTLRINSEVLGRQPVLQFSFLGNAFETRHGHDSLASHCLRPRLSVLSVGHGRDVSPPAPGVISISKARERELSAVWFGNSLAHTLTNSSLESARQRSGGLYWGMCRGLPSKSYTSRAPVALPQEAESCSAIVEVWTTSVASDGKLPEEQLLLPLPHGLPPTAIVEVRTKSATSDGCSLEERLYLLSPAALRQVGAGLFPLLLGFSPDDSPLGLRGCSR